MGFNNFPYFPFLNPKFYNDSPTLIEIVNKLVADMEDVKRNQKTVDEVVTEIHEWINSTGQTIDAQVQARINELYESGTLREWIEAILEDATDEHITPLLDTIRAEFTDLEESTSNTLNAALQEQSETLDTLISVTDGRVDAALARAEKIPKQTIVDFARVGRVQYSTIENSADDTRVGGTKSPAQAYTYVQGATRFTRQGSTYYIATFGNNNKYADNILNNSVKVVLFNENGTELKSRTYSMGHGNSITYDSVRDCFFIVQTYLYTSVGEREYTQNIYKIPFNFDTSSEYSTKNPNITGITSLSGIEFYDGDLYITGGGVNVYKYDWDLNTAQLRASVEIPTELHTATHQELAVNDKFYFFLLFKPNKIIRIARDTGLIDWIYDIPYVCNGGFFPVGEPESISVDEYGNCYMFSAMHLVEQRVWNAYDLFQIWKQNLYDNSVICAPMSHSDDTVVGYGSDEMTIYVNKSVNVFNPTGSKAKPFNTLQEAISLACGCLYKFRWQIVLSNGNEDSLVFVPHGDIWIRGPQSTSEDAAYIDTTTPVRRIGNVVIYGGNVRIHLLKIRGCCMAYYAQFPERAVYQLYLRNAAVVLSEFKLEKGIADDDCTRGIRLVGCPSVVLAGTGSTHESDWTAVGGTYYSERTYSLLDEFSELE